MKAPKSALNTFEGTYCCLLGKAQHLSLACDSLPITSLSSPLSLRDPIFSPNAMPLSTSGPLCQPLSCHHPAVPHLQMHRTDTGVRHQTYLNTLHSVFALLKLFFISLFKMENSKMQHFYFL